MCEKSRCHVRPHLGHRITGEYSVQIMLWSLWTIGRIRRYLSSEATQSSVNALVTSRLDYCNALLHDLPNNKIQRVQHTVGASYHQNILPLHQSWRNFAGYPLTTWSNTRSWYTYNALNDRSPLYINDMLFAYKPRKLWFIVKCVSITLLKVCGMRFPATSSKQEQ